MFPVCLKYVGVAEMRTAPHAQYVFGERNVAKCVIFAYLVLCSGCYTAIMHFSMAMKHEILEQDPILTTEEVARMLAVSKMTVRRWIESGVILREEWFRPGKDYRIYARAVRRLRGEEPAA